MYLTEIQKRGLRKNPLYSCIMQDFAEAGILKPEIAQALVTNGPAYAAQLKAQPVVEKKKRDE